MEEVDAPFLEPRLDSRPDNEVRVQDILLPITQLISAEVRHRTSGARDYRVRGRFRDGTLSASAPLMFDLTTAQFCALYVLKTSDSRRRKRALMHERVSRDAGAQR